MNIVECYDCGEEFNAHDAFESANTFESAQGCPHCTARLNDLFQQRAHAERDAVAGLIEEAEPESQEAEI